MTKNLVSGLILAHLAQFFFKNLALSVTIYYDQLLSSTISEKINDPILRKRSDGRTDGQMDWQMEESDFVGRCPTNVERTKVFFFFLYKYITFFTFIQKNLMHLYGKKSLLLRLLTKIKNINLISLETVFYCFILFSILDQPLFFRFSKVSILFATILSLFFFLFRKVSIPLASYFL